MANKTRQSQKLLLRTINLQSGGNFHGVVIDNWQQNQDRNDWKGETSTTSDDYWPPPVLPKTMTFICRSIDESTKRICKKPTWVHPLSAIVFAKSRLPDGGNLDKPSWYDRHSPRPKNLPKYHGPYRSHPVFVSYCWLPPPFVGS
jgi:hypothetical protein